MFINVKLMSSINYMIDLELNEFNKHLNHHYLFMLLSMQLIIYTFAIIAKYNSIVDSQKHIKLKTIYDNVIKMHQVFQKLIQYIINTDEDFIR